MVKEIIYYRYIGQYSSKYWTKGKVYKQIIDELEIAYLIDNEGQQIHYNIQKEESSNFIPVKGKLIKYLYD